MCANFLKKAQFLAIGLVCFLTVGCHEMTDSVCLKVPLSDYDKLTQPHGVRMYDSATLQSVSAMVQLNRIDVGTYTNADGVKLISCQISGKRLLEGFDAKKQTWSFQLIDDRTDGYDIVAAGFDKSDLDALKIPYQAIPDSTSSESLWEDLFISQSGEPQALHSLLHSFKATASTTTYRLLVNTSGLSDPSVLIKAAKPMGLVFHYDK